MRLPFDGSFPLTQIFGIHPEYYKQFLVKQPDGSTGPLLGHNGIDYGTPDSTPLVSPINGKIIEANLDQNGYGYYVKIENDKEGCVIAHMKIIKVQVGFVLKEGDSIGLSNNTGNSIGPHCHFGYYTIPRDRSNGYGGFIDPSSYITVVKSYTQTEYDAVEKDRENFWKERDAALEKVADLTKQYNELNGKYSAILALGIDSSDKVLQERKDHEDAITNYRLQLTQVTERNVELLDANSKLLETQQKMESENAQALVDGNRALEQNKVLNDKLMAVQKEIGIKTPVSFPTLLRFLGDIYDSAKRGFEKSSTGFSPGTLAPEIQAKADDVFGRFWRATFYGILIGLPIFGAVQIIGHMVGR